MEWFLALGALLMFCGSLWVAFVSGRDYGYEQGERDTEQAARRLSSGNAEKK